MAQQILSNKQWKDDRLQDERLGNQLIQAQPLSSRHFFLAQVAKFSLKPSPTTGGFTLTEVLVVIIIAGVLAAIAAPGWLAFMNRQRVGAAQTELLQMMREAQTQSIAKRTSYGVEIDGQTIRLFSAKGIRPNGGTGDLGNAAVTYIKTEDLAPDENVELEITTDSPGADANNPAATRVYFNFDGSVPQEFANYSISVQLPDQPQGRRCVVIETLLGSMREDSGAGCDV